MLRLLTIPTLLAFVTLSSVNSASAQLFRRDDPAAEKAKQQQQQRAQTDSRQKTPNQTPNQTNKVPGTSDRNSLNNQSNRAGQINRNNTPAQPNKSGVQKNTMSPNLGPSGRYQAAPQSAPSGRPGSNQQSAAQPFAQQNAARGLAGANVPNPQQYRNSAIPPANGQSAYARPYPAAPAQNFQTPAGARSTAPLANVFAPAPVAQPGTGSASAANSYQQSLPTSETIQVGESSAAIAEGSVVNPVGSKVSEEEVEERFGMLLDRNGDQLEVARVKPEGYAFAAGLRSDDKITSIGGAPVSSRAEFYEIARLLSLGDQIEIEFERAGKAEKSLIQFGASTVPSTGGEIAAEASNQTAAIPLASDSGWAPTQDDRTARLEQQVITQQRVIQELQDRIKQLEAEKAKKF